MKYMVIYTIQFSYRVEADNEDDARTKGDKMYGDEDLVGNISDPNVTVKEL